MAHPPPPKPWRKPLTRRRIPAFHPVPVAPRADGWTVARQAEFIGRLYETGSVSAAARSVGMGRESAYRLRRRRGAAGFAAAWDAALGLPHAGVDLASAKATGLPAPYRFQAGLVRIVLYAGRYKSWHCKVDDNALIQLALTERK